MSQSPEERAFAQALVAFADTLEHVRHRRDAAVPAVERRRLIAFAPYLRRLSEEAAFLRDVLAAAVPSDHSSYEIHCRVEEIVRQNRLPSREPFDPFLWAIILGDLARGDDPLAGLLGDSLEFSLFEVQFVYDGEHLHERGPQGGVLCEALHLAVPRRLSRAAARARVSAEARAPLVEFRRRVRASAPPRDAQSYDVRILRWISSPLGLAENPDGTYRHQYPRVSDRARLVGFQVEWPPGERLERQLRRITHHIVELLGDDLGLASRAGRLPDHERTARWWGEFVFRRRTPIEIAAAEASHPDEAGDLADTVGRTLRALGLSGT